MRNWPIPPPLTKFWFFQVSLQKDFACSVRGDHRLVPFRRTIYSLNRMKPGFQGVVSKVKHHETCDSFRQQLNNDGGILT